MYIVVFSRNLSPHLVKSPQWLILTNFTFDGRAYILIKCTTEQKVQPNLVNQSIISRSCAPILFSAQRANLDKYNKTLTCAFIGHKSINLCLFCMKDKGANVITLFSSEVKSTSRVRERGPGTISS